MIFHNLDTICHLIENKNEQQLTKLWGNRSSCLIKTGFQRSYMMLSGNNLAHLNKLDSLTCDTVMLNLEDGVHPSQKIIARELVTLFLSRLNKTRTQVIVRVNPLGEGGEEDIIRVIQAYPDGIRVPKIISCEQVKKLLDLIPEPIEIHLSIETKEAFRLLTVLAISPRIRAFYLGILDLSVSLGLSQSDILRTNPTTNYILSRFLVETLSMGVKPVGFVFQNHANLDEFQAWCEWEKMMGYGAKGTLSPAQSNIANDVFSPSVQEIDKAKQIVTLFDAAQKEGLSSLIDPVWGFIDEPIYKNAKNILQI